MDFCADTGDMCGRFGESKKLKEQEARFFAEVQEDIVWEPSPNIGPGQNIPIIFNYNDKRHLRLAHWGFTPDWAKGKPIINARSEQAANKSTFKEAFEQRRCLVPATWYYEWQATESGKQPHLIKPSDQELFGFAALWQTVTINGQRQGQFTIMTVEAAPSIAHIHNRMPVILSGDEEDQWLEETLGVGDVEHICEAYPDDLLEHRAVSKAVNSIRNQDWSIIEN